MVSAWWSSRAVRPVHTQPPLVLEAVDLEQVQALRARTDGGPRRLVGRPEERVAGEDLVELPEVVEDQRWLKRRCPLRRALAQVAQDAVVNAPVRDAPQTGLDGLERVEQVVAFVLEHHREQRGEPAHRP